MRLTNGIVKFYLQVNELLREDSEKPVMVILKRSLAISGWFMDAYQVKATPDFAVRPSFLGLLDDGTIAVLAGRFCFWQLQKLLKGDGLLSGDRY